MISHAHIIQFVGIVVIIVNGFTGWVDVWLMFIYAGVIPGIYGMVYHIIKILKLSKGLRGYK